MRASRRGTLAAAWALVGFSLLLLAAIARLLPHALALIGEPLSPLQWLVLLANTLFMLYTEGYRGFQLSYAPKLAARIVSLRHPTHWLTALAAPLYAMGFFLAPRRQIITTWLLTLMIVAFVLLFRLIPQPWRGILDLGVVLGLSYGLVVCWWFTFHDWREASPVHSVPHAPARSASVQDRGRQRRSSPRG